MPLVTLINPFHSTKEFAMARRRRHSRRRNYVLSRPRLMKKSGHLWSPPKSKSFRPGKRLNRRRHYRHLRHNPAITLRNILSRQKIMYLGGLTGGLVLGGAIGMPLVNMAMSQTIDKGGQYRKFYGVGNIILGILLFGLIKKPIVRLASTGVIVSGIYDLIAENSSIGLMPLPTSSPVISGLRPRAPVSSSAGATGTTGMDYMPMSAHPMGMDYRALGADDPYTGCLS